MTDTTQWIDVGTLEDIPMLGARVVRTADGDIAVFRNRQNEVFALLDRCPHKGGPLSQGIVHGRYVTCPLHAWCIGLADGEALPPDKGSAPTHEVRVENGRIQLRIGPSPRGGAAEDVPSETGPGAASRSR